MVSMQLVFVVIIEHGNYLPNQYVIRIVSEQRDAVKLILFEKENVHRQEVMGAEPVNRGANRLY